jgi:hypothetical protein
MLRTPEFSLIGSIAFVALSTGDGLAQTQPDFLLPDVNPGSERAGQKISPRQYQQQITVWYFGREW